MSWALINTILAFQVLLVYLLSVNVSHMLIVVSQVRERMVLFDESLQDIREEMTTFIDGARDRVIPMPRNIRFIAITSTLAVFAHMNGADIAWLPLVASVWYALESFLDLLHIGEIGRALNINLEQAEDEIVERAWYEQMEALAEQAAEQAAEQEQADADE